LRWGRRQGAGVQNTGVLINILRQFLIGAHSLSPSSDDDNYDDADMVMAMMFGC
jgi:hypothetical protein